ncbi:PaaX family transcriptional regulator C-terminal domain-containing protein [Roseibium sp. RKSG952]|uniref:PaaX family transcriptional regulator C-terminal domain-containing protein n=1 Tax=Roseibium sp. RKSG952 TaxID=2529384 RepID=UPI0012BD7EEA|nr:PaaX family transcriptional regulator C-terminal domain-containing protein [Roseibium sp. RKSG952]MTH98258.1 PaaX family transcriptional regulator [Roseibium sp. RKSG952]
MCDVFASGLTLFRPRAAGLVVTVYGDVAQPRQGVLWMGNLIQICGRFGFSETNVRTAVSRLVANGQLVGERVGRKSYYRLTDDAGREYLQAARQIFLSEPRADKWCFVAASDKQDRCLQALGFARLSDTLWVGPDKPEQRVPGKIWNDAAPGDPVALREFSERCWDLGEIRSRYAEFVRCFCTLGGADQPIAGLTAEESFTLRLLLVHAWRGVVLKDPMLPLEALGADWPGHEAEALFAKTYLRLSDQADHYICQKLEDMDGPLHRQSASLSRRQNSLRAILS